MKHSCAHLIKKSSNRLNLFSTLSFPTSGYACLPWLILCSVWLHMAFPWVQININYQRKFSKKDNKNNHTLKHTTKHTQHIYCFVLVNAVLDCSSSQTTDTLICVCMSLSAAPTTSRKLCYILILSLLLRLISQISILSRACGWAAARGNVCSSLAVKSEVNVHMCACVCNS